MNTPFEKRICFTVCICQMTAVLSCVSIVYLTVAIYKPAYLTLNSGFLEEPVMCTTFFNNTSEECDNQSIGPGELEKWKGWYSCSEWCLSKSGGSCPRILVDVRRNGSAIRFEGCENLNSILCSGIDPAKKAKQCIIGECAVLNGLVNCTSSKNQTGVGTELPGAKCIELESILECNHPNVDPYESSCATPKGCMDLNGFHICNVGKCRKINVPYNCEKRCIGIETGNKTVIIREGDRIFSAQCARAINTTTGDEIWPLSFHSTQNPEIPKTLLMFCTNLLPNSRDNKSFDVLDCFNGTLLEPNYFGNTTNIVTLLAAHLAHVDAGIENGYGLIGPTEVELLIQNNTRLYINFEPCVNTLILNECEKFFADYGRDGKDWWTHSRFKCYYNPSDSDFVVLRFSRIRTLTELILATTIPFTLFIVSCLTLFICSRIIRIGDDSHFYLQCCGTDAHAILEKDHVQAMAL